MKFRECQFPKISKKSSYHIWLNFQSVYCSFCNFFSFDSCNFFNRILTSGLIVASGDRGWCTRYTCDTFDVCITYLCLWWFSVAVWKISFFTAFGKFYIEVFCIFKCSFCCWWVSFYRYVLNWKEKSNK